MPERHLVDLTPPDGPPDEPLTTLIWDNRAPVGFVHLSITLNTLLLDDPVALGHIVARAGKKALERLK